MRKKASNIQSSFLPTNQKITILRDSNEKKPFNFPTNYTTGNQSTQYELETQKLDLPTITETDDLDLEKYFLPLIADNYIEYLINISKLKLDTGDYSIKGIEKYAVVERKTLTDLAGCVFKPRFSDCINRLLEFPYKAIVVEAQYSDILAHNYESRVDIGRFITWINGLGARGLPVHFAGDRQTAMEITLVLLVSWYNKLRE